MTVTTKDRILAELRSSSNLTAYDIYDAIQSQGNDISSDTIDRNLKELTDRGVLVREKRESTSTGRQVYHYSIPGATVTPVDNDGEVDPDFENDEEETYDEAPEAVNPGPQKVYLVRKNDIPSHIWGSRQFVFARLLSPFVHRGRPFSPFGNTVVSIFSTTRPLSEIDTALTQMPDVHYVITTSLEEAIRAIESYGTLTATDQYRFTNWSNSYFTSWGFEAETAAPSFHEAPAEAPAAAKVQVQSDTVIVRKDDLVALRNLVDRILGA